MALTAEDEQALKRLGLRTDILEEGGMTCVVLHDFKLPNGFTVATSDLLLRLNPGFPDVHPDMWWFDPPVQRVDGGVITATEHTEQYLGKMWQRWSRHLDPSVWQSGIDTLESFVAVIRSELVAAAPKVARCA